MSTSSSIDTPTITCPPWCERTYPEANRARESAWNRLEAARADYGSWARVIAEHTARGWAIASITDLLVARAAEMEARADWVEAHR